MSTHGAEAKPPTPAPERISWRGPNRWTVWMDEDGCHMRSPSGDALEMVEVRALFDLWSRAQLAYETQEPVEVPRPTPLPF